MTLRVAMAQPHSYILVTGDFSVYARVEGEDSAGEPVQVDVPRKAEAASNHVLFAVGGCVDIAADFRRLLHSNTGPDDDIDAVVATAADAIADLRANDRAGEPYGEIDAGRPLRLVRGDIDRDFTLALVGFRHDGTADLIEYGAGAFRGDPVTAGDCMIAISVPNGVPVDDVIPFYLLRQPPSPAAAFAHAHIVHHSLHRKHPARVTTEIAGTVLGWHGTGLTPSRIDFTCDSDDLDTMLTLADGIQEAGASSRT